MQALLITLVQKLILPPLFIGLVSLAGRRFGLVVSGLLVGLPLTSAPVSLFLALEQGTTFASHAAQSTLLGTISIAAFCLAYAWFSLRISWPGSWFGSWGIFFAITLVLSQISPSLPISFIGVVVFLVLTFLLLPKRRGLVIETHLSPWEIPGRMLVATSSVLILTGLAHVLGSRLSGLLSVFPLFATIIVVAAHHLQGEDAARRVLRGVIMSLFANAIFFLLVAALLTSEGIAASFGAAALGALFVQGCVFWLLQRQSKSKTSP
jgi:uncharacterized membrane protein (GlpM family)